MSNSFNSIDRLMEFGMGLAVATQMVRTMNQCIDTMKVPGANNSISNNRPMSPFFIVNEDKVVGGFTDAELSTLIKAKTITQDTLIWRMGMPGWTQAKDVPEVYKLIILND